MTEKNLSTYTCPCLPKHIVDEITPYLFVNASNKNEYPELSRMDEEISGWMKERYEADIVINTTGSTESILLALLAAKLNSDGDRVVMNINIHSSWDWVCKALGLTPVYYTNPERLHHIDWTEVALAVLCDHFTVGAFKEDIDDLLTRIPENIPVHLDAAISGFLPGYIELDERIVSMNVSGHKYGGSMPGLGFALFKAGYDHPDLYRKTSYLMGDIITAGFSFTKSAAPTVSFYKIIQEYFHGPKSTSHLAKLALSKSKKIRDILVNCELGDYIEFLDNSPVISIRAIPSFHITRLESHGWNIPISELKLSGNSSESYFRMVIKHSTSVEDFEESLGLGRSDFKEWFMKLEER